MYKTITIYLLNTFLVSCVCKEDTAILLHNTIRHKEEEVKKIKGYVISKRSNYYIVSIRNKHGCIVSDFKKNEAHHLSLRYCKISDIQREEVYSILEFIEDHSIVSIRGDFSATSDKYRIEFRTPKDEILVYHNNDIKVKHMLIKQHASFKDIDKKWGYYLGNKID